MASVIIIVCIWLFLYILSLLASKYFDMETNFMGLTVVMMIMGLPISCAIYADPVMVVSIIALFFALFYLCWVLYKKIIGQEDED